MKGIKWTGECAVNLFLLLISTFYLSYSLANYDIGSLRMPERASCPCWWARARCSSPPC